MNCPAQLQLESQQSRSVTRSFNFINTVQLCIDTIDVLYTGVAKVTDYQDLM